MSELLVLPFPSTAISEEPVLKCSGHRVCSLEMVVEETDFDAPTKFIIIFINVHSYKSTYQCAITVDMIEAYDKVISIENSKWLESINSIVAQSVCDNNIPTLQHLRIYFDDGPCYEFICSGIECSFV